eukprot:TRINITY_DN42894_c0_g1_i1.p1 TRINITY_DN42894_c0_g1~~TRINITY_DN42894_c0_g1_i1.p1  ORF type:complete len:429 (-),score=45.07 TRINITY_DN42894_c0_g1_i1:310-1539(-)
MAELESTHGKPSLVARFRCMLTTFVMAETAMVVTSVCLWPALLLLPWPGTMSRKMFLDYVNGCQRCWLGLSVFLLRYCTGIRIYIHGQANLSTQPGDVLIISNHRTRLDWMFLWGFAAAMQRLSGLKIVLKDSLRKVPFFGWATQCFAFAFMCRRDRDADLQTLISTAQLHGGRSSLAMLLFPEGTDLSENNVAKSNEHAKKSNLPEYHQTLHPRTAGFAATWKALCRVGKQHAVAPPTLLDLTMAYVDYLPYDRPNEASVFLKGRPCREVHILWEAIEESETASDNLDALCRKRFAIKEERLRQFYAPLGEGSRKPDISALQVSSSTRSMALEDFPGVWSLMLGGVGQAAIANAVVAFGVSRYGWKCPLVGLCGVSATFTALGWATGGIDKYLHWHAKRWPAVKGHHD